MINTHSPLPLALSLLVACNSSVATPTDNTPSAHASNMAQLKVNLEDYTKEDEALFGSPLAYFIAMDELISVQALLKTGADVNSPNFLDETPLEQAIQRNSVKMVDLLIKQGANVNYLATSVSCNIIVASANAGNSQFYEMPLDHAYKKGNSDIIHLLEQAGAKSITQCSATENTQP